MTETEYRTLHKRFENKLTNNEYRGEKREIYQEGIHDIVGAITNIYNRGRKNQPINETEYQALQTHFRKFLKHNRFDGNKRAIYQNAVKATMSMTKEIYKQKEGRK